MPEDFPYQIQPQIPVQGQDDGNDLLSTLLIAQRRAMQLAGQQGAERGGMRVPQPVTRIKDRKLAEMVENAARQARQRDTYERLLPVLLQEEQQRQAQKQVVSERDTAGRTLAEQFNKLNQVSRLADAQIENAEAEQRRVRKEALALEKSGLIQFDQKAKMFKPALQTGMTASAGGNEQATEINARMQEVNQTLARLQQSRAQIELDRNLIVQEGRARKFVPQASNRGLVHVESGRQFSEKVPVVSPRGQLGLVPYERLQEYLRNGYRMAPPAR